MLNIDLSLRTLKDESPSDILLYSSDEYTDNVNNKEILLHTITFIKNTKQLERPQFDHRFSFLLSLLLYFLGNLIRNAV